MTDEPMIIRADCGCRFKVVSALPVLREGVLELVQACHIHVRTVADARQEMLEAQDAFLKD